jgi:hypothetical protein
MREGGPPPGYTQFVVGNARVVCTEALADDFRLVLHDSTLYDYAARDPGARTFAGRGASYAIPLPSSRDRVVVRHNRHGGLLARFTGDRFRAPTRAPLELALSERLRSLGVPTPQLLGYVTYPAGAGFERADVATRLVDEANDLVVALMSTDAAVRGRALQATAKLIGKLADAGARHHDLNIKNVLLQATPEPSIPGAFVLDVDRVTFGLDRRSAIEKNVDRLVRSAKKWQRLHDANVTDAELDSLGSMVRGQ